MISVLFCYYPEVKQQIYDGSTGSEEEDEELFSWEEYLKKCHARAVPKETFKHVSAFNTICLGTTVELHYFKLSGNEE